jgi:hypothetical protein
MEMKVFRRHALVLVLLLLPVAGWPQADPFTSLKGVRLGALKSEVFAQLERIGIQANATICRAANELEEKCTQQIKEHVTLGELPVTGLTLSFRHGRLLQLMWWLGDGSTGLPPGSYDQFIGKLSAATGHSPLVNLSGSTLTDKFVYWTKNGVELQLHYIDLKRDRHQLMVHLYDRPRSDAAQRASAPPATRAPTDL